MELARPAALGQAALGNLGKGRQETHLCGLIVAWLSLSSNSGWAAAQAGGHYRAPDRTMHAQPRPASW